jgi:hypothetical protein
VSARRTRKLAMVVCTPNLARLRPVNFHQYRFFRQAGGRARFLSVTAGPVSLEMVVYALGSSDGTRQQQPSP